MFEKLVIFDYSGTLSTDAVRFGENDRLTETLKRSGLTELGIADTKVFWEEIVNPSWEEGSTASIGYVEVITRQVKNKFSPAVQDGRIRQSAERFVDSYLTFSRINGLWRTTLEDLDKNTSVITVIATDHYAEATGYIIGFLEEMGAAATSLTGTPGATSSRKFIVANSADMGFHKADPGFWEKIKSVLNLNAITSVLIIDDFGANEKAEDTYADQHKVDKRKHATVDLLKSVFSVPVYVIPFVLSGKDKTSCRDLIFQVSLEIDRYLLAK